MYCKNCGKEIDDNAVVCPNCGVAVQTLTPAAPAAIHNPSGKGLCISGFVVSLLSLWFGAYFCIMSIIGLVLSAVGMSISKKNYAPRGFGIAGLVISIVTLVIWGLVYVFAASLILSVS